MTKPEEEEKAPVKMEKRDVIVQKVRFCDETNCQSPEAFYCKLQNIFCIFQDPFSD